MSTENEVVAAVESGSLVLHKTGINGDAVKRVVLLHKSIHQDFVRKGKKQRGYRQLNQLKAQLDSFVRGQAFDVNVSGPPNTFATIALLSPLEAGVFEMRCLLPEPGIRLFGQFVAANVFAAGSWELRDVLEKKGFQPSIDKCLQRLEDVLPYVNFMKGMKADEYVTNT